MKNLVYKVEVFKIGITGCGAYNQDEEYVKTVEFETKRKANKFLKENNANYNSEFNFYLHY